MSIDPALVIHAQRNNYEIVRQMGDITRVKIGNDLWDIKVITREEGEAPSSMPVSAQIASKICQILESLSLDHSTNYVQIEGNKKKQGTPITDKNLFEVVDFSTVKVGASSQDLQKIDHSANKILNPSSSTKQTTGFDESVKSLLESLSNHKDTAASAIRSIFSGLEQENLQSFLPDTALDDGQNSDEVFNTLLTKSDLTDTDKELLIQTFIAFVKENKILPMSLISELITKNNLTGFPSIYPLIRSQIKEVGARGRCADLSLADQIKQIHSSPIQGEDRLPQQVRMDVIRKLDDFKLDHQDGHILLITSGLKTALKNSLESQSHPLQKLFNEIKVYSTREKIKEAEKNALVEYLKQVPTHLTQQPKLILEVVEQPNFQPENLKPHVENLKKQLDAMQAILDAAPSEEVFSQLKEMYISILETPQNSADESSTAGNFDEVCFHLLVQPDGYSINGIIEHAGICIITQNGPCQIYKGSKCDQILFLYYNGKDHYQSISRNVYTKKS